MNIFKRIVLVAAAVFAASFANAQTASKPPFPRTAIYAIGGPHDYYNASRQNELARYNIVIINAYPGWEPWRGITYDQIAKNIHARNANSKVFLYTFNNEFETSADNTLTWSELAGALDSNNWWLYQDGARAKSTFGNTSFLTNPTLYGPKNSAGQRFVDWMPRYLVKVFNASSSAIDGFYLDNMYWRPHRNGDWNNDGVTDDTWNNPNVGRWLREGLRVHFQTLQSAMPGKLQLGNTTDWAEDGSVLTEYQGLINGGLLEGLIGVEWSAETTRGWAAMMAGYRRTMATFAEPKMGIVHMAGDPNNFQEFRYGFASTLMDDGYFAYSQRTSAGEFEVYNAIWFDEYDAALGQATSAPPTSPWQKGVYRRDYEKGVVLVNPKGNGAQDVTLETDFRRIAGKQDPNVNNGQTMRLVRLNDRDGIVVMRITALSRPAPPTNVIVE
jgi:hypothetical protein